MSPQLQAMISAMLQLKQMRQQNEQFQASQAFENKKFDAEDHERKLNSASKFISFMKTLPPEARQAWIQQAAGSADVDPQTMGMIAGSVPTDPATIAARLIERGSVNLNPEQVASIATTGQGMGRNARDQAQAEFVNTRAGGNADLWNQYMNREMTGTDAGANALSSATAKLSPEDLTSAAKYQLSLGLTPAQVAQNLIAQGQLGIAKENADIAGFSANTQRTSVRDNREQWESELALRAQGLYSNGANGGVSHDPEIRAKNTQMLVDVLKQLNLPGTPMANQEAYRQLGQYLSMQAGMPQQFLQYLSPGSNQAKSPNALTGLVR